MNAIRVRKHLDSVTVPELEPMLGRDVDIIVIEETAQPAGGLVEALGSFDHLPVDPDAIKQLRENSKI